MKADDEDPSGHYSVLPHSLFASPTSTICLITADPQRPFKDAIAHQSFPAPLRSRITRVIGLAKLRAKYKSFESRRQLLREHDVFLADDRVVTLLPQTLGKAFYRTSAKRPVPVILTGSKASREKLPHSERSVGTPSAMANEITRALSAARVNLAPSTSTAVRVAKSNWPEEQVVENIEVLVREMVQRFVPQRWSNVKSLHIKGPRTTGLPLWMADQLWLADEDVIDDPPPPQEGTVDVVDTAARRRRQRKRTLDGHRRSNGPLQKSKPLPAPIADGDGGDGDGEVDQLIDMARAKRRLKRQKMEVLQSLA